MGGPGSGRKKGSGGKSEAMKFAMKRRNYAKSGGLVVGKNATSANQRYKKNKGLVHYLKKTGQ